MGSRGLRLGVDAGQVRVGLAMSDPDGMLATPHATLVRTKDDDGVGRIAELVTQVGAVEVVVGLPLHMSGAQGAAARASRAYATTLARAVAPVPVRMVDERLSTVSAHAQLHSAGRRSREHRGVVDQVAASVILQSVLDAIRSSGRSPGEVVTVCEDSNAGEEAQT